MKRWVVTLIGIFLLGSLLFTPSTLQAQGDTTWVGEYFNNLSLSGTASLVRADAAINFNWGDGSPDPSLAADRFSVRWTKAQYFEGGTYQFTVRTDDGIRIYIDNVLVLDAWYDQAIDPAFVFDTNITTGQHALRVEYYENTGVAAVSVGWTRTSSTSVGPWTAEYYNNTSLIGPAVYTRTEPTIDFNWGFNAPVPGLVPADNFSVRWTGSPHFAAGTYTFVVHADDGVRLWVDNMLIIDAWRDSGFTPPYTATLNLGQGQHAIRVEYYERFEVAAIRVEWMAGGIWQPTPVPTPVPTTPPPPPPATTTGAWLAQYFSNTNLNGFPAYTQNIPGYGLNLLWRSNPPVTGIPADYFSARLTRSVNFAEGTVRFILRADDGLRFYIDNNRVLDEWHLSSGDYFYVEQMMSAGEHTLTLEYYEATQIASLRFYWVYTRPPSPGTGVNAQVRAQLLNVRLGPSVAYPIIGRIRHNELYTVTGRSASDSRWVRINFGNIEGWINGTWTNMFGDQNQLPIISGEAERTPLNFGQPTGLMVRTTANLNVRSGPGIGHARVGWLSNGTLVDVVGRNASSTWWEVNFVRGRGWISGAYVQREGNQFASVPVTG